MLCLVAQLCLTLCNLMDCSLPDFSVHGDFPGKNTGVCGHALPQGIFPTQGLNPGLPHCKKILYHLSHQESSRILEWVAMPSSRGSSQPRNRMGLPCITGGFLTSWATREASTYEYLILGGFPYGHLRYNVFKTELVQNLHSKLNSVACKMDKSMDSEDEFPESETFLDHLTSGWPWGYSWIYLCFNFICIREIILKYLTQRTTIMIKWVNIYKALKTVSDAY